MPSINPSSSFLISIYLSIFKVAHENFLIALLNANSFYNAYESLVIKDVSLVKFFSILFIIYYMSSMDRQPSSSTSLKSNINSNFFSNSILANTPKDRTKS